MRIGLLVGREESFPAALLLRLAGRPGVEAAFIKVGGVGLDLDLGFDVILDRISHEVPAYRALVLAQKARGVRVINDPGSSAGTERFADLAVARRLGIRTPKTVLLPQKDYAPTVTAASLRNLDYPIDWSALLDQVGRPAVLKASGAHSWCHAIEIHDVDGFVAAFDRSGSEVMMLQQSVGATVRMRCLVVGGRDVIVARFDPDFRCYVHDPGHLDAGIEDAIGRESTSLGRALGLSLAAVEWAVGDDGALLEGVSAHPDLEESTLTPFYFEKVVALMAEECCAGAGTPAATGERGGHRGSGIVVSGPGEPLKPGAGKGGRMGRKARGRGERTGSEGSGRP